MTATPVTLKSAKAVAFWKIKVEASSPLRSFGEKLALGMATEKTVGDIFDMLDQMGFCVAFKDENHPFVKSALADGNIVVEH